MISYKGAVVQEYRLVCLGHGARLVLALKRWSDQITTRLSAQCRVVVWEIASCLFLLLHLVSFPRVANIARLDGLMHQGQGG